MSLRTPHSETSSSPSLYDEIFRGHQAKERPRRRVVTAAAWTIALVLHIIFFVAAGRTEPSLEVWSARVAALVHKSLADQAPIAIEPAPPPMPEPEPEPPAVEETPPEPEPEPEPAPPPPKPKAVTKKAPPPEPPPPAQAGRVITAEPVETGPVDLTDNTFVTGTANAYVGGATTKSGTNDRPVDLDELADGLPDDGAKPSRARRVQLEAEAWRCAWPAAAIDEAIYEQSVVLKVNVSRSGQVEKVQIIDDPGFGFGDAAAACASKTRFTPALDRDGKAIKAMSPPIRVRFTR